MRVVWGESDTCEAYIAVNDPNFYSLMEAYNYFGYYPPGHHKQRGKGTWGDVATFGLKLVLALTLGSAVDRQRD